jgi:hypothetical protein
MNGFKINWDRRTGEVWVRAHDTVQELIDQLRASHRIHRALVPISNEMTPVSVLMGVWEGIENQSCCVHPSNPQFPSLELSCGAIHLSTDGSE